MAWRVVALGVVAQDGFKTMDAAQRWAESQFQDGTWTVEHTPESCC